MITNWKSLGGRDHDIVLVVPGKNTAAYKNFDRQVIKRGDIIYDFMTYKSTMAIKAVKKFPYAISFIAHGAASRHSGIKTIKIDGLSPKDENYPYYQAFSFVSKGEPRGVARKFIAFALSGKGRTIMLENGMTPVTK
jgi:phosphate transport system substrate-binding protein